MGLLTGAGHGAWFVGGCVRNALIGAPVSDLDITTSARPDDVLTLAKSAGLKAIPTGLEHGTVTIVANHVPFEITTLRRDVETYGRHATVAFADTIEEDARRRDFTMNALYADANGNLLDPLGGLPDLSARRVRFIEDATARIREDYLRSLRFFRFHAWYGDPDEGPDAEALAAIADNLEGIGDISRERTGAEMLKLLSAPDPAPAIGSMAQTGALLRVLPGADPALLSVLVHLEAGRAADPLRRLAAIGGEDPADRLRLSKSQARSLSEMRDLMSGAASVAEIGYRFGAGPAVNVALLRGAVSGMPVAPETKAEAMRGAAASFPVRAADLMPEHTGPALGKKLKHLESLWIASDFALTREALLAHVG